MCDDCDRCMLRTEVILRRDPLDSFLLISVVNSLLIELIDSFELFEQILENAELVETSSSSLSEV